MKKTFKVLTVVAMALGMFFTSCSQPVSNIEVVTVDASEITVKSYPGCNEVSWTPVSNAKYVLYRNGVNLNVAENATDYNDDINIVDGVEYTYTVYTFPKDLVVKSEFNEEDLNAIGGNKVAYYTKGNKSSVTVTAIVPPFTKDGALVTALDLIDYDPNANAEAKVTAENINFIYDDVDNTFKIEFPAVEYLTYDYKLYRGNAIEVFGKFAPAEENTPSLSAKAELSKGRASASFINKTAGDYTLEVTVSKTGYKSSKVIAANKITVETIDVSEKTGTPVVAYIDNGENARVMWTPAVKSDKKTLWPEANYIVYVKDAKGVYTAINEVKAASTDDEGNEIAAEYAAKVGAKVGDTVYYVDYPVVNNKLSYVFYVVLNADGKLEEDLKSDTLEAYADLKEFTYNGADADFYAADADELKNDVLLTFTGLADDQEIVSVKYLKFNKNTANANEPYVPDTCVLDENFTEVPAANSVDTWTGTGVIAKYTYLVKDLKEDECVVFLYEISKEGGYKSLFGTEKVDVYTPNANAYNPISWTRTREDSTKDWTYDFAFYAESDNTKDSYDVANNWTYSVYYGLVENDVNGVKKWNSIGAITPKLNETKTAWEAKVEDVTLAAKTPEYDPTTNDVTGYKSTYQIKIVAKYNLVDNVEEVTYREVDVAKDAE